jgi:hypothetical protein
MSSRAAKSTWVSTICHGASSSHESRLLKNNLKCIFEVLNYAESAGGVCLVWNSLFCQVSGGALSGEYLFWQYVRLFSLKNLLFCESKYTIRIARICSILWAYEIIFTAAFGNENCDFLHKLLVNLKFDQCPGSVVVYSHMRLWILSTISQLVLSSAEKRGFGRSPRNWLKIGAWLRTT